MKKFFVMLMAVAAIGFVSCSGNNEGSAEQSTDSVAQVSPKEIEFDLDGFKAKLDEAIKSGDKAAIAQVLDEAKGKIDQEKSKDGAQREAVAGLWAKIKAAVDERAEELKKLGVDEAVNKITNVDEELKQDVDKFVQQYVEQGKQAVENAANDAVDQATQQVADKANEAADKAQQAANDAANKAQQAANNAANKAQQAANDAANKAKQAANDAANKAKQAVGLP